MEIEGKNTFLYGKFYDADRERGLPSETSHYDIVVYSNPEKVTRVIGSLEGIFVTESDKFFDKFKDCFGAPCSREQMMDFEEVYEGKFIAFNGSDPVLLDKIGLSSKPVDLSWEA